MSDSKPAGLTDKQHEILEYFRRRTDTKTYFKSRHVAEDLGFSAQEVGTNIARLAQRDIDLDIEEWGYSSSTTWKVTK